MNRGMNDEKGPGVSGGFPHFTVADAVCKDYQGPKPGIQTLQSLNLLGD